MVWDEQHGDEIERPGEQQAVEKDNERSFLEIWQFWRLDLAIDLRERLFAAHREVRVTEGDDDAYDAEESQPIGRIAQRLGCSGIISDSAEWIDLFSRDQFGLDAQVGLP